MARRDHGSRAAQLGIRLVDAADKEMTTRLERGAELDTWRETEGVYITRLSVWASGSALRDLDGGEWRSGTLGEAQGRHRDLVASLTSLAHSAARRAA